MASSEEAQAHPLGELSLGNECNAALERAMPDEGAEAVSGLGAAQRRQGARSADADADADAEADAEAAAAPASEALVSAALGAELAARARPAGAPSTAGPVSPSGRTLPSALSSSSSPAASFEELADDGEELDESAFDEFVQDDDGDDSSDAGEDDVDSQIADAYSRHLDAVTQRKAELPQRPGSAVRPESPTSATQRIRSAEQRARPRSAGPTVFGAADAEAEAQARTEFVSTNVYFKQIREEEEVAVFSPAKPMMGLPPGAAAAAAARTRPTPGAARRQLVASSSGTAAAAADSSDDDLFAPGADAERESIAAHELEELDDEALWGEPSLSPGAQGTMLGSDDDGDENDEDAVELEQLRLRQQRERVEAEAEAQRLEEEQHERLQSIAEAERRAAEQAARLQELEERLSPRQQLPPPAKMEMEAGRVSEEGDGDEDATTLFLSEAKEWEQEQELLRAAAQRQAAAAAAMGPPAPAPSHKQQEQQKHEQARELAAAAAAAAAARAEKEAAVRAKEEAAALARAEARARREAARAEREAERREEAARAKAEARAAAEAAKRRAEEERERAQTALHERQVRAAARLERARAQRGGFLGWTKGASGQALNEVHEAAMLEAQRQTTAAAAAATATASAPPPPRPATASASTGSASTRRRRRAPSAADDGRRLTRSLDRSATSGMRLALEAARRNARQKAWVPSSAKPTIAAIPPKAARRSHRGRRLRAPAAATGTGAAAAPARPPSRTSVARSPPRRPQSAPPRRPRVTSGPCSAGGARPSAPPGSLSARRPPTASSVRMPWEAALSEGILSKAKEANDACRALGLKERYRVVPGGRRCEVLVEVHARHGRMLGDDEGAAHGAGAKSAEAGTWSPPPPLRTLTMDVFTQTHRRLTQQQARQASSGKPAGVGGASAERRRERPGAARPGHKRRSAYAPGKSAAAPIPRVPTAPRPTSRVRGGARRRVAPAASIPSTPATVGSAELDRQISDTRHRINTMRGQLVATQ